MRKDMHKVLTERPRHKGRGSNRNQQGRYNSQHLMGDDYPSFQSMKETFGPDGRKDFADHWGPVKRWLHSKVGKPWNEVYSELRQQLDLRNKSQWHLWQHIIFAVDPQGQWKTLDGDPWGFHVDDQGIFQYALPQRKKYSQPKNYLWESDTFAYLKYQEVWYEVRMKKIEMKRDWRGILPSKGGLTDYFFPFNYKWPGFLMVEKKQLNSRKIRQLKLEERLAKENA